jgi:hypothetical protein
VIEFFKVAMFDWYARKGEDKTDSRFQYMDDKWLFTHSYFDNLRRKYGFRELFIVPSNGNNHRFLAEVEELLYLGLEETPNVLPTWARDYLQEADTRLSDAVWRDLYLAGTVVLKK